GGGAMTLVVGMLAALLNVQETRQGQVIDAAITDGAALSTALIFGLYQEGHWRRERQSNLIDGCSHWYDCYECADGTYISLGALEPPFYRLLLDKLGLLGDPDFAEQFDHARWPAQKRRFVEIFKARTRKQWCELFEGTDVCFAPVLDFDEAPKHQHNLARKTFISVAGVTQPAPAPRFSETPSAVASAPPDRGQHTEEVLAAAGLTAEELTLLREQDVL
ncbi:MAG: CoA transferase, partial [Woeseiaceae bacterium]